METQFCAKCEEKKFLNEFCVNRARPNGLSDICRACAAIKHKRWYSDIKNAEKVKERSRTWTKNNQERRRKYLALTAQRRKRNIFLWRKRNKKRLIIYKRTYEANRKKNDINFRILCNYRNRLLLAIKNNSKSSSTVKLLGCSIEELKQYLEQKFTKGMSWDNYGIKGWHIDHILPCSSFDLSLPAEQVRCFHYTNLQPLWHIDNIRKSNSIIRNPE